MSNTENEMQPLLDTAGRTGAQANVPDDRSARTAGWVGLFAALGMTSCCILPLALALMGVTGSFIGTMGQLEPLQPWFMAVALIALAWGFWRAYRPLPVESCAPGCATGRSRRMTRIVLWLALAIVLFVQLFNFWIAPTFLNPFG